MSEPSERYKVGIVTRRSVLGDEHVNAASGAMTPFDEDFQTFITEGVWGSLWSRPTLTRRERSIITLALLAALGHDDEFLLHIRATRNTGATMDDVKEAILHAAVYAGVPAGNHAFKIAKRAFLEMREKENSQTSQS